MSNEHWYGQQIQLKSSILTANHFWGQLQMVWYHKLCVAIILKCLLSGIGWVHLWSLFEHSREDLKQRTHTYQLISTIEQLSIFSYEVLSETKSLRKICCWVMGTGWRPSLAEKQSELKVPEPQMILLRTRTTVMSGDIRTWELSQAAPAKSPESSQEGGNVMLFRRYRSRRKQTWSIWFKAWLTKNAKTSTSKQNPKIEHSGICLKTWQWRPVPKHFRFIISTSFHSMQNSYASCILSCIQLRGCFPSFVYLRERECGMSHCYYFFESFTS